MALATQEANLFTLECGDTQVSYSTSSLDGRPRFSYAGPEGRSSLSGDEIDVRPSALGVEVTVPIENIPDERRVTFTLLIPSFRLPQDNASEFDTLGIKTTHRTTLTGPPEGPEQTYEAVELHGTAQSVVF